MIFVHDTPTNRLLNMVLGGGSPVAEYTATGNPLTFITDRAKPLKSLLIPFTPIQQGTGDPSPTNVRNIVPWNGLTVWNGGKNLLQNTASSKEVNGVTFTVNSDGTVSVSGTATGYADLTIGKSEVPNKGKIVLSGLEETVKIRWSQIRIFDADDNVLGDFYGQSTARPYVINMDDYPTAKYIQIGIKREDNNVAVSGTVKPMLEVGETATAYEPYKPITETDISFPSPVYGGTLDAVTGVLADGWNKKTVAEIRPNKKADHIFECYFSDRKYGTGVFSIISDTYKTITAVSSTGSTIETLYTTYGDGIYINSGPGTFYICDSRYTDVEEFKTAMADTVVVYELATPQEIQLTPAQITALVGNNTIWSDADGSMTAVYFKKG